MKIKVSSLLVIGFVLFVLFCASNAYRALL